MRLLALILMYSLIFIPLISQAQKQVHSEHEKEESPPELYQCPMHPQIIRDKPGQCPICGMDLVPVKSDPSASQNQAQGTVQIPLHMVQKSGVKTSSVTREVISHDIRAYAKITTDESKIYHIHPKINGWIEKLFVTSAGEKIEKGKPVLAFYSPEIYAAFQDYVTALKSGNTTIIRSSKNRLKLWDVSDTQLQEISKTLKAPRQMTYESPIDGYIVNRHNTFEGMFIKAGEKVFTIADLTTIWAEVDIYEFESPWVKVGLDATMELPYLTGQTYSGKVTFVSPFVNDMRRTIYARLEFPNPTLDIKPGMFANVTLHVKSSGPVLSVPIEAVLRSGKRNVVFATQEDGVFEPKEVKIGRVAMGSEKERVYEILEGLQEGEQVVTSGQFLLDSESRLQEAIKKMMSEGRKAHSHQGHQH